MKKIFFAIVLSFVLISCKKEETQKVQTNSIVASISDYDFSTVKVSSVVTKDEQALNVSAEISYTGGNGKYYSEKIYNSYGVTGLTATLGQGSLAEGKGVLTFAIRGIPTSSGKANFNIEMGSKTGVLSIEVLDINQVIGKEGLAVKDIDGNIYKTVTIGNQTWMAENLKTSKYNDGTLIENVTEDYQWENLTSGAWAFYKNDSTNYGKFGKLYNWFIMNPIAKGYKNVCPIGWHIPSEADWKILIDYLGGLEVAGGKLKQVGISNWNNPNKGALNTSLFEALPGGVRNKDGSFEKVSDFGYWWSSTEVFGNSAWINSLRTNDAVSSMEFNTKNSGVSIRCIKD